MSTKSTPNHQAIVRPFKDWVNHEASKIEASIKLERLLKLKDQADRVAAASRTKGGR